MVAILANNIALILKAQGDLDGALAHVRRALEIDEAVYGKDHAKGRGSRSGGRRRSWNGCYGPDHPHTVIARKNLAALDE